MNPSIRLRGHSYCEAEKAERERIRTLGVVDIDRRVFKKTKKEKELLKLAKLQCKIDEYLH